MRENCIMDFLKELERNNDLKWMADHKAFKEQAAAEFEELLQMVMEQMCIRDSFQATSHSSVYRVRQIVSFAPTLHRARFFRLRHVPSVPSESSQSRRWADSTVTF